MSRPELVTRNNAMVALYLAGLSAKDVGALFGRSDTRVFQILKRRGVRRPVTKSNDSPTRAAGAKE